MAYGTIFHRSFGKHNQKKLVYGAFLSCLIIALNFRTVFKPDLNPLQRLSLKLSLGVHLNNTLKTKDWSKLNHYEKHKSVDTITSTSSSMHLQTEDSVAIPLISDPRLIHDSNQNSTNDQIQQFKPICNTSHRRTDVCQISGDVCIDCKSSSILLALPNTAALPKTTSWSIKPYPRKDEKTAMGRVSEFQVKINNSQFQSSQICTENHNIAGIIFSTGGYSRNHFHAFTDILIPLYLTSREFNGEVIFLVTNYDPLWINKYMLILQKLSKYDIIDIDKEDKVHCFPKMIVGLKLHKEFQIDPSISRNSMDDFRKLLKEAYSLKRKKTIKLSPQKADKAPRLLIISRRNSRSLLNEDEVAKMGRNLGFEVIIAAANPDEAKFANLVNSCDVAMGVHGAGLTNIVYLPEKAVLIQIVPLGEMDWIAKTDFGEPAKNMNLRYIEYKISENESSLIEQYPRNHPVFRDPHSISQKGWLAFKEVYLMKQNVKLDVGRFRKTLLEALKLLSS